MHVKLYLRDDIEAALRSGALGAAVAPGTATVGETALSVFERLYGLSGQVHRQTARRRTLRCTIGGRGYFLKAHAGIGWRAVVGEWARLKTVPPGARDEFRACRRLADAGIPAPGVAAYGSSGWNPATRRSFVLCDALDGYVSLEDFCNQRASSPLPMLLKRRLLAAAGTLAARMHAAGIHHRDFYLCHLLADEKRLLAGGEVELAVIDLHRAVVRKPTRRPPSRRMRVRDLAALRYSAAVVPLSRTDLARFARAYAEVGPAASRRDGHAFWAQVAARAERLLARAAARGLATGERALTPGAETAASVGDLEDLGRQPPVPFRFDADFGDGGRRVVCTEVLRVQPGRRLVALAQLDDGDQVVVKGFCGRHASRDWRRERRGHEALSATGVPVPRRLGEGRGARARLLCFEHIRDSRPAGPADAPGVLAVLARLHAAGVRQRDLHFGNFLVRENGRGREDGPGRRASAKTGRPETAGWMGKRHPRSTRSMAVVSRGAGERAARACATPRISLRTCRRAAMRMPPWTSMRGFAAGRSPRASALGSPGRSPPNAGAGRSGRAGNPCATARSSRCASTPPG